MPSKACIALALAAPAVTAFNFGGFGKKTSAPKPSAPSKSSGGAYPSVAVHKSSVDGVEVDANA